MENEEVTYAFAMDVLGCLFAKFGRRKKMCTEWSEFAFYGTPSREGIGSSDQCFAFPPASIIFYKTLTPLNQYPE